MGEAIGGLLRSRKFLLAVIDAATSLTLYFVARYVPGVLDDVKFLIVTLQPVILIVIAAYAYEDAQTKAAVAAVNRQFFLSQGRGAQGEGRARATGQESGGRN